MNRLTTFLTIFCTIAISATSVAASFQSDPDPKISLSPGYYVVIGAYASTAPGYASRFALRVTQEGNDAESGYSELKNMHFVYLYKSENFEDAIQEMKKTRSQTAFNRAWVYVNKTGGNEIAVQGQNPEPEPEPKVTEREEVEPVVSASADENVVESAQPANEPSAAIDTVKSQPLAPEIVEEVIEEEPKIPGFNLFLNVVDIKTQDPLDEIRIEIVDPRRSQLMMEVEGNTSQWIKKSGSGFMPATFIARGIGWRTLEYDIVLQTPLTDSTLYFAELIGDTIQVNFEMTKVRKGDVFTLYNVYFFKDAAVMRPDSKYEMSKLLAMLQESPNQKIKLHGHTNGNVSGKIIELAEGDVDFFALTRNHKEAFGSAKELSKQRAFTIKRFLEESGIAPDRIEIQGWGGKKMLYDKHDPKAKLNVRVEVEVMEE